MCLLLPSLRVFTKNEDDHLSISRTASGPCFSQYSSIHIQWKRYSKLNCKYMNAELYLTTQFEYWALLAIHYTARVDLAFSRVAHICRDVNYNWLLRTIHANGASFFFYLHLFSHWSGDVLWFISLLWNMNDWNCPIIPCNSRCFFGVCSPVRSNVLLGSYCNYKLSICRTLYW